MATSSDDPQAPQNGEQGFSETAAQFDADVAGPSTLLKRLAEALTTRAPDAEIFRRSLEALLREGEQTGGAKGAKGPANSSVRAMAAVLDGALAIVSAPPDVQVFFGARAGETLGDRLEGGEKALEKLQAEADVTLVNFYAADGRLYPAALRRLADVDEAPRFRLAVQRLQLSPPLRAAIKAHYRLSASEMSVVEGIIDRRTAQQIAIDRNVQKSTVTSQIHNIVKKLASDNITDATLKIAALIAAQPDDLPLTERTATLGLGERVIDIKSPAASLHYRKMGETGGTPVLILHGLFDAAPPPERFARDLVRRGYCPFFLFRPGFGRSTALSSEEDIISAIEAFAQRALTTPAVVVGLNEAQAIAARLVLGQTSSSGRGRRGGGVRGAVLAGVDDWTTRLNDAGAVIGHNALARLLRTAVDRTDIARAAATVYGGRRFDNDDLMKTLHTGLENNPALKTMAQDLARPQPGDDVSAEQPSIRRKTSGHGILLQLEPMTHRLECYETSGALIKALDETSRP
ncbi:MAG: hypothetical protein AAF224_02450 [Pseudomonadota bacterium]